MADLNYVLALLGEQTVKVRMLQDELEECRRRLESCGCAPTDACDEHPRNCCPGDGDDHQQEVC